jgi:hypothetical protein
MSLFTLNTLLFITFLRPFDTKKSFMFVIKRGLNVINNQGKEFSLKTIFIDLSFIEVSSVVKHSLSYSWEKKSFNEYQLSLFAFV